MGCFKNFTRGKNSSKYFNLINVSFKVCTACCVFVFTDSYIVTNVSCIYPEKFEGFEIGAGDIKNIEEGREAYGLLIIAIVMLLLALRGWKVKKSKV